ncbi:STAS domain-containing protein [Streptomyces malaysiensis]|uniref:STAS domain-containing protein n=1 Tax=Streptomyces malaysiensis TaxID=92644 RepID=UPI001FCDD5DF|nr:STAS domain-containing protein [Streptomyces malaysiensis]
MLSRLLLRRPLSTSPWGCLASRGLTGARDDQGRPEGHRTRQLPRALGENRVVVIDLGGLTFCDCTGLSALLATARTAHAGDAELRLCAVPHFLARILRLSGTHGAFTIEERHDQA